MEREREGGRVRERERERERKGGREGGDLLYEKLTCQAHEGH